MCDDMAKATKPDYVQLFEDLLWANLPRSWMIKTTFFNRVLYVSIFIQNADSIEIQKIRRSFKTSIIKARLDDIHGMASDCINEMIHNG